MFKDPVLKHAVMVIAECATSNDGFPGVTNHELTDKLILAARHVVEHETGDHWFKILDRYVDRLPKVPAIN